MTRIMAATSPAAAGAWPMAPCAATAAPQHVLGRLCPARPSCERAGRQLGAKDASWHMHSRGNTAIKGWGWWIF
jgi:hypothetical protein